jgi:TonB family protein
MTVLTASEEDGIRSQIESNWNLGELAGSPEAAGMVVELRVYLLADGTITDVKLLNDRQGDAMFQKVAESAIRAVKISSPLKLPPGKNYSSMVLRFRPDWVHS